MQENIPYYPLKSSARGLDFSVSSSSSIPISEPVSYTHLTLPTTIRV